MSSSFWLKLYLLTVPVFFATDMIWLGFVAKPFYQNHLRSLLSPQVNWTAALVFYFIYITGILFFAVRPGLDAGSLAKTCAYGALFGFFTYATYDLTNHATLQGWPMTLTLVDIPWGMFVTAVGASAGYLAAVRFG